MSPAKKQGVVDNNDNNQGEGRDANGKLITDSVVIASAAGTTTVHGSNKSNAAGRGLNAVTDAKDDANAKTESDTGVAAATKVTLSPAGHSNPTLLPPTPLFPLPTAVLALRDRDCILGNDNDNLGTRKANWLLKDLIHVMAVYYKFAEANKPVASMSDVPVHFLDRVVSVFLEGKPYELVGLREVPTPFMRSKGNFVVLLDKEKQAYKVLTPQETKEKVAEMFVLAYNSPFVQTLQANYPTIEAFLSHLIKERNSNINTSEESTLPLPIIQTSSDVDLQDSNATSAPETLELRASNKNLFTLTSQNITVNTNTSEGRTMAVFRVFGAILGGDREPAARFLIATNTSIDQPEGASKVLDTAAILEFLTIFAFEVFLDKDLHVPSSMITDTFDAMNAQPPSRLPISDISSSDVLFGRGGMTNAHVGNRRFRDIITLHRPDYVRAVKIDKPAVARRIVKAIRLGSPPGRFLKRQADGLWYDVGDRVAAEKTSQALRERSNAEKRERSALREAMRIQRNDMTDDQSSTVTPKSEHVMGQADAVIPHASMHHVATAPINATVVAATSFPIPSFVGKKSSAVKVVSDYAEAESIGGIKSTGLPPNAVDKDGNILVTDYDILCGRGGLTNHHKGNKRFRDVVALHRPDYVRASKVQKPSVARVIVRAIRNGDPPGRFLQKDSNTDKWIDVGDKKAAEKTSQALREKSNDEREKARIENPNANIIGGLLLPNILAYKPSSTVPAAITNATATTISHIGIGVGTPAEVSKKATQEKSSSESHALNSHGDTDLTIMQSIDTNLNAIDVNNDEPQDGMTLLDDEAAAAAAATAAEVVAASIGEQILQGTKAFV